MPCHQRHVMAFIDQDLRNFTTYRAGGAEYYDVLFHFVRCFDFVGTIQMSPAAGGKTCIRSLLFDHHLACVATLFGIAIGFFECMDRKHLVNFDIQPLSDCM